MTGLVIHADDLTGAAETAALFRHVSPDGTNLQLGLGPLGAGLTVLDLDTRNLSADQAERSARDAIRATGVPVFTKLDSMLRGQYAAHLRALDPGDHPVVVSPALPAAGRAVVNGRLFLRDRDPLNVYDVLADLPANLIGPATGWRLEPGRIAVADGSTDEDLDKLVDATWHLPGIRYAGAGGLAAAISRRLTHTTQPTTQPNAAQPTTSRSAFGLAAPGSDGVLYVVGTAEAVVHDQIAALQQITDVTCATISPAGPLPALDRTLRAGGTVILKAPAMAHDPADVAKALAVAARELLARSDAALVLTGGHTARTVLDALGVDRLGVVDEIHHGAVLLRTQDGRPVVTRPGSFGERSSLATIHAVLRPSTARKATTS